MDSSLGFGSTDGDLSRFRTRFRSGSVAEPLNLADTGNSPVHSSIGTPSSDTKSDSDRLAAYGFRFSFIPLDGVLLTFPSRYSFTIGRQEYLALECGHPRFPRDSSCPVVLKTALQEVASLSPTGLSPSLAALPRVVRLEMRFVTSRETPQFPPVPLPTRPTHRPADHSASDV